MLYIAFISLTEVYYITMQEKDESSALRRVELIKSLNIRVEESNENLNLLAGKLKATNRISLADAYIAALCHKHKGILVHKDPEFEKILPPIKDHNLPYKFF